MQFENEARSLISDFGSQPIPPSKRAVYVYGTAVFQGFNGVP